MFESNGQQERQTAWTQSWRVEAGTGGHQTPEIKGGCDDWRVGGSPACPRSFGQLETLRWMGTRGKLPTMFTLMGSNPWLLLARGEANQGSLQWQHPYMGQSSPVLWQLWW